MSVETKPLTDEEIAAAKEVAVACGETTPGYVIVTLLDELATLRPRLSELEGERDRDLADVRRFQSRFITVDQFLRALVKAGREVTQHWDGYNEGEWGGEDRLGVRLLNRLRIAISEAEEHAIAPPPAPPESAPPIAWLVAHLRAYDRDGNPVFDLTAKEKDALRAEFNRHFMRGETT